MPILKSLNFVATASLRQTPEMQKRSRLVERLNEQRSLLADPRRQRTVNRWIEKEGRRVKEPHQVNIKPWWARSPEGKFILVPKFGLRPLEFEKGKPGILLEKESQLAEAIDTLIAATNAGELDQLLARAKPKANKA